VSLVVVSAPWIIGFEVEPLAEQRVESTPEASAPAACPMNHEATLDIRPISPHHS
jgi:hypothetical protein